MLDPAPGVYAACLAVKYGILVCYLCITAALSLDAQLTGPAAASTNPFTRARHLQGEPPELDLPLPEVDAARVAATCDDQVCYADAAARALPDEAWRRLEAPLLPGAPQAGACQQNRWAKLFVLGRLGAGRAPLLDGGCVQPTGDQRRDKAGSLCCSKIGRRARMQPRPACVLTAAPRGAAGADASTAAPSWLDGGSARSLAGAGAPACVVGEALEAAVAVHNPLALDLDLTGVRLLFEHDGGGGGGGGGCDKAGDDGPAAEVRGRNL